MTQAAIARKYDRSQRAVFDAMQRWGIRARAAKVRKGTRLKVDLTLAGFLHRVKLARGKPKVCERCLTRKRSEVYVWVNVTGRYDDVEDYDRVCRPCHLRRPNAKHEALRHRVWRACGKPKECSRCGTHDRKKLYEWVNLTGRREDVNDYARMCRSCHYTWKPQRPRRERSAS